MKGVYECIHIENKKETIYRFIGSKPTENEDVDNTNEKTIIIQEYIFNDDTLLDIHQKIKKYIFKNINIKSLYCWCESIILYEDKNTHDFVDECFFDKFEISRAYFQSCIYNKFGKNRNIIGKEIGKEISKDTLIDKESAVKILKSFNFKYSYEPLSNSYSRQESKYLFNYQINPVDYINIDDDIDDIDDINIDYDVKSINHKTIESLVPRKKRWRCSLFI